MFGFRGLTSRWLTTRWLTLQGMVLVLALAAAPALAAEYQTLEWPDLMTEEDLRLLEDMPPIDHDAPPMFSTPDGEPALPADDPWMQVLTSTRVREEYDQQPIRLPGYVVPLEFDDDQIITEFFLVPFFGACIHVPPPPPNQIIHVRYPQGFELDALYTPVWIAGTLRTEEVKNSMAHAVYAMTADTVTIYEE